MFLGSEETYVGGDVIVFRPKNVNPLFLSYALNHSNMDNLRAKLSKGEIVIHIYSSILKNIKIAFPTLNEQDEIVGFIEMELEKVRVKENDTQKEIRFLKEYRETLIFEAVTGKIDVTIPSLN